MGGTPRASMTDLFLWSAFGMTRTYSLLIRSHRQRPATTCNLSRAGPYPRIQVQGRSWSSVAVDVTTDVGEGLVGHGLSSAGCQSSRRSRRLRCPLVS
jgi:hypothetical protein